MKWARRLRGRVKEIQEEERREKRLKDEEEQRRQVEALRQQEQAKQEALRQQEQAKLRQAAGRVQAARTRSKTAAVKRRAEAEIYPRRRKRLLWEADWLDANPGVPVGEAHKQWQIAKADMKPVKPEAPTPEQISIRIPRDADDFETVCAEWMKKAGFVDVERTPKGPDGGIDTIASEAVGQAKFHPSQKVTGESVRALVGSKIERKKKRALFFHYGPGYTPDAIEAARSTGVELYQLDVDKRRFKRIDK